MKKTLVALAAILIAAASLAPYVVWRTFPQEGGTVRVAGHAAPIRIETDGHGLPTIRAQSVPDAMFGLDRCQNRRVMLVMSK